MKRYLSSITVCLILAAELNAQTNVSGGIFANTTWTKANSPYIVTGTVAVFPGNTLTIEPGVEVRFTNSTLLEIRDSASLYANGTLNDSITFTSNQPSPAMNDWLGLDLNLIDALEISYATLEYAQTGIEGQGLSFPTSNINIEYTRFYRNNVALDIVYHRIIDHCIFTENRVGIFEVGEGSAISDCSFIDNNEGIQGSGAANQNSIENSVFCGNHIGLGGVDTIRNCTIVNNDTGIAGNRGGGVYLINNVIAHNNLGVEDVLKNGDMFIDNHVFKNRIGVSFSYASSGYQFTNNNICDNTLYNAQVGNSTNFDLTGICWCLTDSSDIASAIYDGYDNVNLGLLNFIPFANCNSSVLPADPDTNCTAIATGVAHVVTQESNDVLYPNPANTEVTLVFEQKSNGVVQIFRNDGVLVDRISINASMTELKIDLSQLPNGLYIVTTVRDDKTTTASKLMVTH